jgi:hypothetical protein
MRNCLTTTVALLICGTGASPSWAREGPPQPAYCAPADPPASQPAEKVFDGLDDALKTVPAGVLPKKPEEWTVAKRDVANAAFDQKVKGQRLKVRVKVAGVGKDGDDYIVSAEGTQTAIYTTAIDVHFGKDSALDVARLTVGDEIIVIGQVNFMTFSDQGPLPELGVVLVDATVAQERRK